MVPGGVRGQVGKRDNGSSCGRQYEEGRAGGGSARKKKDANVGKTPRSEG